MNFFSNPKSNRQSILFFCLASLIMLLCGVSYSWSLFVVPIEMEMQWSRSTLALAYSYNLYAYCLGGVFAGFARRKINFRQIMFAGVFLMGLGYAGLSTVKSSGHLFLFSILRGWGNGMLYNTILALAPVFFGEKNMFYTGFLLFALGMSSMLLSPLLNWGITFWGWRMVFLVIGLVDAVLLFICTIFIPRPFALNSSSINKVKPEKSLWGLSSKEMLATPVFWLAFLWSTIFGLIGQAYVSQAAACATDIRATALQASLVVSLFSACNGIGRILLGKVYNIGRFRMGIILVCLEFLSGGLLLTVAARFEMIGFMYSGTMLLGLGYGALMISNPSIVREFFGMRYYGENFGILNLYVLPSAMLSAAVMGNIYTAFGSYLFSFILFSILSAINLGLSFFLRSPKHLRSPRS